MPQLHRHSHSQPQLYRQTYNLNRPGTGDHGDIATIDLTIAMMAIPEKIRPFSIQALPRDFDLLGGLSLLSGATCMVFQHSGVWSRQEIFVSFDLRRAGMGAASH